MLRRCYKNLHKFFSHIKERSTWGMKRSTVLIGWKSYTSEKLLTLWHANSTVTTLTSRIHGDGQPFLMCWSFGSGLASAFTRSAWSVSEVSFSRHMALWLCCTIFFFRMIGVSRLKRHWCSSLSQICAGSFCQIKLVQNIWGWPL